MYLTPKISAYFCNQLSMPASAVCCSELELFLLRRKRAQCKILKYVSEQAAKVSRVDRDIPKSSSSHPQVI